MDAKFLGEKFAAAASYEDYLKTGTDEQRRRWGIVYEQASITDAQRSLVTSFTREMKLLVVSGIWCGDCVQQVPLIQRIAEANASRIKLRIVDRDVHKDLSDQVQLCGGARVPVVLFLSEDDALCGIYGDRTLARYRAIAMKQLGAACATGIGGPDLDEQRATTQDWLNEIERVQLMLRVSPRLRQKYGD